MPKLIFELDIDVDGQRTLGDCFNVIAAMIESEMEQSPLDRNIIEGLLDNYPDEKFVVLSETLPSDAAGGADAINARLVVLRTAFDKTGWGHRQAAKHGMERTRRSLATGEMQDV